MTNDPQVYCGFVLVNLSSFYSGQIFLVVHLKICPLQPKFVKWFCFSQFVQFLLRTNFFGGAFEDLSTSAKICQVAENHPHL